MSNPSGDSTITGLPLAQPFTGTEFLVADQKQGSVTVTVKVPVTSLQISAGVVGVNYGTTAQRPAVPYISQAYFDTSLGLMIWCKQATPSAIWVDAAGVSV